MACNGPSSAGRIIHSAAAAQHPPEPAMGHEGITSAERYLKQLCDHTFLSLWSYLGTYRDQGKPDPHGDGKEVCNLLVVVEDHIIIFSDKDCKFPDSGDLDRDWSRWYRRAVRESADQVWGLSAGLRRILIGCSWTVHARGRFHSRYLIRL